MKNKEQKNFHVVRLCISTYQAANYAKTEESALSELEQIVSYSMLEAPSDGELILITNTNLNFSSISEEIKQRTALLIHPNSGYDNIPFNFVQAANFPIILGNPIRAHAVVEYTMSCLFHHFSQVPYSHQWKPGREWNRQRICDQKVQIIGHGHIGKPLCESLKPLVKELWIFDPYQGKDDLKINQADVIILAASLEDSSRQFLNERSLAKLKDDVLIINGARGKLIEQKALLNFLSTHPKATAYLDVFEKEPLENEFEGIPNAFLSSHIAGVYSDLDKNIALYVKQVAEDYLNTSELDFQEKYKMLNLKNFTKSSFLN